MPIARMTSVCSSSKRVPWVFADEDEEVVSQNTLETAARTKRSVYSWDDAKLQSTKVYTVRQNRAANVLQRFFVQKRDEMNLLAQQQKALEERLAEIERVRQQELDDIAKNMESMKLKLLQEVMMEQERTGEINDLQDQEEPSKEMILELSQQVLSEHHVQMTLCKKKTSFLKKRCIELKRENEQVLNGTQRMTRKLARLGNQCNSLTLLVEENGKTLAHHQDEVDKHKVRLLHSEKRWKKMKRTNKKIRDVMDKVVKAVEDRHLDSEEKWELVDELYSLRRGTRKCKASSTKSSPKRTGRSRALSTDQCPRPPLRVPSQGMLRETKTIKSKQARKKSFFPKNVPRSRIPLKKSTVHFSEG